jgi:hypothetical protein
MRRWKGGPVGKGSRQRPCSVPEEERRANWDLIFRKPKPPEDHYCTECHYMRVRQMFVTDKTARMSLRWCKHHGSRPDDSDIPEACSKFRPIGPGYTTEITEEDNR